MKIILNATARIRKVFADDSCFSWWNGSDLRICHETRFKKCKPLRIDEKNPRSECDPWVFWCLLISWNQVIGKLQVTEAGVVTESGSR
ncbi:MAG: hypothetical protein K0Q87_2960 [Neobacillus sp.]|nr:hypothetical protein [Neobacillus sp.]